MLFTITDYIIMIGSVILLFIVLSILISNNPRLIETAIETSSTKTNFDTTFFELYEKSVDAETCNRLIIVQPFKWHIWATNGDIFLLNESNKSCPLNYTPAILVPNNKSDDITNQVFKDVCINKVFNDIIISYTDKIQPIIVKFNIEELQQTENKFTILDALNFLVTKYITMNPPKNPEDEKIRTDGIIKLNKINTTNLLHNSSFSKTNLNTIEKHKLKTILQKKLTNIV